MQVEEGLAEPKKLEAKVSADSARFQSLIDLFIPTIDSEHGICYTQPEKLPGKTPIGRLLAQTRSEEHTSELQSQN